MEIAELRLRVTLKRKTLRLPLRTIARQCGVSASTLSRIENKDVTIDGETYLKLERWVNGTEAEPVTDTLFVIDNALAVDKKLTKAEQLLLSELIRNIYSAWTVGR